MNHAEDGQLEGSSSRNTAEASAGSKRRRTAIACKSCRLKKTRCDGGRPICNHCKDYGFECSFTSSDRNVSSETHVRRPYSPQRASRSSEAPHPTPHPLPQVDLRSETFGDRQTDSMQTFLRSCLTGMEERLQRLEEDKQLLSAVVQGEGEGKTTNTYPSRYAQKTNTSSVSAMGLGHRGTDEAIFFDTMAPADLATPMLKLVEDDPAASTNPHIPRSDITAAHYEQTWHNMPLDANLFHFPEKTEAFRLLRIFESQTSPLYPLFPSGYLRTAFSLHSGIPASQLARLPNALDWSALLMAIFALAYAVDGVKSEALAYGDKAHKLLRANGRRLLRTIMAVQASVVLCQFLQSTDQHEEAWLTLGWVVRMAFALGLHTNRPCIEDREDTVQEEMACRTYWAIFILDRATTMTLGRPGAIGSYIPGPRLPKATLGESERFLDFFRRCIRLYEIFGLILESHASEGPLDTNGFVTALERWQAETPSHLSTLFNVHPGRSCDVSRADISCIVLTFRFFMVRMLVQRPVIGQAMDSFRRFSRMGSGSFTPVPDAVAFKQGIAMCSLDAMRIISIGKALSEANDWPRGGSSWYRLYYLFSAFTVLAGSLLHSELQIDADTMSALPSRTDRLQACRDSIKLMDEHLSTSEAAQECSATASRLMKGLQKLEDQSRALSGSIGDTRTTEEMLAALDADMPDIQEFLNTDWLSSHSYLEGSGMSDTFWGSSAGTELNILLNQATFSNSAG